MRRALSLTFCLVFATAAGAKEDAMDRLRLERLEQVHRAILALQGEHRDLPPGKYQDIKAILHLHSKWSHDSRGTIEEIVAAAKQAGVSALLFTEHPAAHYDFVTQGHHGTKDGVLLIPGAETGGFLAYPTRSIRGLDTSGPQEFADLIRRQGGRIFLCHLEERMDWSIRGLTGSEIYNTHADVKEERRLMSTLASPFTILSLVPALKKFPQETYGALLDYPADYLRRYDELCRQAPHTGIAGNDAHHNIGVRIVLFEPGKLRIEDALGQRLADLDARQLPMIAPFVLGRKPGDVVFALDLDPYERSFRHVATHLFVRELSEAAVWEALEAGRAYVAFDWLGEARGFQYVAVDAAGEHPMGSRLEISPTLLLRAKATLPVAWKLYRVPLESGPAQLAQESKGRDFEFRPTEAGNYRIEAWLDIAGTPMAWILSNPIYLRPATEKAPSR